MVAAGAAVLLLAGCHPGTASSPTRSATADSQVTTSASASPSSTPTAVAPVDAPASDYLLDGTPYQADANGEWSGHYGFFTDAGKAVACDLYIYSGDSGGVSCDIEAGHESQRSYAVPASVPTTCQFDPSDSYQLDGTALSISYKAFPEPLTVGFSGCLSDQASNDPAVEAKRKVLPPNTILTVTQTGFETYTCTVAAATASCADSDGTSFVFGLSTATFHQG